MEARCGGGTKKARQWTEGIKTEVEKIGWNYKKPKKHRNRQKSNIAKHQNKYRETKVNTEKPKQKTKDLLEGSLEAIWLEHRSWRRWWMLDVVGVRDGLAAGGG